MSSLKRMFSTKKTPKDLIKDVVDLISTVTKLEDPQSQKSTKLLEELAKRIAELKALLLGETDSETKKTDAETIGKEAIAQGFISLIVKNFDKIGAEAQRDAMHVFNNLLKVQSGGKLIIVEHIQANPTILDAFLSGLEKHDIAQMYCQMLCECVKHESLAQLVLPNVYVMFKLAEETNFEVSSNAFVCVKEVLTRHKALVANFMDKNFDQFFDKYSVMVNSDNYLTKRQSLKLLSELLLDRSNLIVMKRYINKKENMQLIMNALIDKRRNIQFEAFHVFKLFIANPNKEQPIKEIIRANNKKLIKFLKTFQEDRTEDQQFLEEKELLISKIVDLDKVSNDHTEDDNE